VTITAPTDIADCEMWLDATQEAYANGNLVPTWTDRTGNGNDATQGSSSFQPTFRTNIQNGQPVLEFNSDFMAIPTSVIRVQAGTSFVVAQSLTLTIPPVARYVLAAFRNPGPTHRWYIAATDAAVPYWSFRVGATGLGNGGEFDLEWNVLWLRANGSAKSGQAVCEPVVTFSDGDTGNPTTLAGIGALGTQEFWRGYIAEVIHYDRALSDLEVDEVRVYLNQKWAIPDCLPAWIVGKALTGSDGAPWL
jgi:hypothetical protein